MSMAGSQPDNWPIGIVGGGRMGVAIAYVFLTAGYEVTLIEPVDERRAAIPGEILSIASIMRSEFDCDALRISPSLTALSHAALIIEAAPEKLELKQKIFAELDAICTDHAILATNTSVIPIREIAVLAKNRARVVGAHFWNPPYKVKLVEVVQSDETAPSIVKAAIDIFESIGLKPVHVRKDVPGFIGNRMQHALKREAIALVQSGVCDAETVDFVIRNSFGSRLGLMGTLEQSDLVGLNLTLDIHKVILRDLDRSTEPQALLVELVAQGKTGVKVGEGFRRWTAEQAAELTQRLNKLPNPA